MQYSKVKKAVFLKRPNRFIAIVRTDKGEEIAHVKNTGRCAELLIKGATVWLYCDENPKRKTAYDLIAVEKTVRYGRKLLINMDSQAPNEVAEEWLKGEKPFGEGAIIKREVTHGDSRFDFYIESKKEKAFLEVKGVTLEENGIAMFPDAPTERGIKHIEGLIRLKSEGFGAYLLFVIQMKGITALTPNVRTHKAFADALKRAEQSGVNIICIDTAVSPNELKYGKYVNYCL